jgi:diguanylate cyclase (GGDEF)-like protein/PAS domain S-box-containing protein
MNLEAERLLGYPRAQLLGRNFSVLVPESVRPAHARWHHDYLAQPTMRRMGANRELRCRHADGHEIPVEIGLNPVHAAEQDLVVATVLDITTRKLSREDSLTGLANRREFDARVAVEYARSARHGHPLSFAMLDLDRFKDVNDRHGHALGDRVLQRIAAVLAREARAADVAARYGGEEFVLALPDTGLLEARSLCERIRRCVEGEDWGALAPGLAVTVSIGVATRAPEESAQEAIEAADRCLYAAKQEGRNRVCARSVADPALTG